MRALDQTTKWIWEPDLLGLGGKSLGTKSRAGLPFPCLPGLQGVVLKSCSTGGEGMELWMRRIVWESVRSVDDIQVLF